VVGGGDQTSCNRFAHRQGCQLFCPGGGLCRPTSRPHKAQTIELMPLGPAGTLATGGDRCSSRPRSCLLRKRKPSAGSTPTLDVEPLAQGLQHMIGGSHPDIGPQQEGFLDRRETSGVRWVIAQGVEQLETKPWRIFSSPRRSRLSQSISSSRHLIDRGAAGRPAPRPTANSAIESCPAWSGGSASGWWRLAWRWEQQCLDLGRPRVQSVPGRKVLGPAARTGVADAPRRAAWLPGATDRPQGFWSGFGAGGWVDWGRLLRGKSARAFLGPAQAVWRGWAGFPAWPVCSALESGVGLARPSRGVLITSPARQLWL